MADPPKKRAVPLGKPLSDVGEFVPDEAGAEALLASLGKVTLYVDPETGAFYDPPLIVDAAALFNAKAEGV